MAKITHKDLLADGLVKRTYDITKKQGRGLQALKQTRGTPASVSIRFALESYLEKELGDSYK